MRKFRVVFGLCLCALIFCACSRKDPEYVQPTNFYYCNTVVTYNDPLGVISPEVRESVRFDNSIDKFMAEYLRGPISDNLYAVIPDHTSLLSTQVQETTALLHFSKGMADLSGVQLTCASVSVLKSLYEFAGIETIVISAEGSLLDEKESFIISLEDVVTMDAVTTEK